MRKAEPEDARFFWELANDPLVRQSSFSTAEIPWDDHVRWFSRKLEDSNAWMLVILQEQTPAGWVRFDGIAERATVGIALLPSAHGKGLALAGLVEGCAWLFRETEAREVDAYIRPENGASLRLFSRAGFRPQGQTQVRGVLAEHYVLSADS